MLAGLTVSVVLLPQAIAFAQISELPPQMGLYTAIVAAIVGALWGSSAHLQTGPVNTIVLLLYSTLLTFSQPENPEFILAAGMLAVMAGLFQLLLGIGRMGMLVNFVSHSVVVGFSTGAGVLIAMGQVRYLLGLDFSAETLLDTLIGVVTHLPQTHQETLVLGLLTIGVILVSHRVNEKLPGPLIAMAIAGAIVAVGHFEQAGVQVIGKLPTGLPPIARLPLFNLRLFSRLSAGALAIGAIGLIQSTSITRKLSLLSHQPIDNNQEFIGQGLANIVAGFFSGFPCAGSFSRSAVSFLMGAKTRLAGVLTGGFVFLAMRFLGDLAAYIPRTALAGVLIVTAYGLIDQKEIVRIWRGARADAVIMAVTFLGTLFLHLEFAVLTGILLSFALYILKTSLPRVVAVLPDETFSHFVHLPHKPQCPQLAIMHIMGDLYFGAVNRVEKKILDHLENHPDQRFLILRMSSVNQMDYSGIHMLENILDTCRERGGDVFLVRPQDTVLALMKSTGFFDRLGERNFLSEELAVTHLFYRRLDPAICIYECEHRVFRECQNLPKQVYPLQIPHLEESPSPPVPTITARELWLELHRSQPPLVIDVREPREYQRGHIPQAKLVPLPHLLTAPPTLPRDRPIVLVCRSGRRSRRAAHTLILHHGYQNISLLSRGMLAWKSAGLLEAVE